MLDSGKLFIKKNQQKWKKKKKKKKNLMFSVPNQKPRPLRNKKC
jgi:hypothetical protein